MLLLDTNFPRYELYRGFPATANLIFELDNTRWARYTAEPRRDDCVIWVATGGNNGVEVGYCYKDFADSLKCNDCMDLNPSYTYDKLAKSLDKVFSKEEPDYDD
jgi:hypothetical protein